MINRIMVISDMYLGKNDYVTRNVKKKDEDFKVKSKYVPQTKHIHSCIPHPRASKYIYTHTRTHAV